MTAHDRFFCVITIVRENNYIKQLMRGKTASAVLYCRGDEMPNKPLRPCKRAGCAALTSNTYCEAHRPKQIDNRLSAAHRGYTSKWSKARKTYLAKRPWCEECERQSKRAPAAEVDHIIPHCGDMVLFWSKNNWQGLCKSCHSTKTAQKDGGFGNKKLR